MVYVTNRNGAKLMASWIRQLLRKVQLEPIELAFVMEMIDTGQHVIGVYRQVSGTWQQISNVADLWSYGYREETKDPYVAYVLTETDQQTLYALKSLNPDVHENGTLVLDMTLSVLHYLRSKPNVEESERSRQLLISDQPVYQAARVDFDPTAGVRIETGYSKNGQFTPAQESGNWNNDTFVRKGNIFWPVSNITDPVVLDLLDKSPKLIPLENVPEFIQSELGTIKTASNILLSDAAVQLRVIQDPWKPTIVTPIPQESSNSNPQDQLDFQIEYEIGNLRLPHSAVSDASDQRYYRYDDTTWILLDTNLITKMQTKIRELAIAPMANGYKAARSTVVALKSFADEQIRLVSQSNLLGVSPSLHATTLRPISLPTEPRIQDRFVEILPTERVEQRQPFVRVSIAYETEGTRFLREAQRYRDREGNPAEPVLYMQYWPTYSSMNPDQQRWYFYWRTRVRQGAFLPTDLSYIFVHVYELLNLIETTEVDQAVARLKVLWQTYRSQHPRLDNYLPDWAGDLLALKSSISAAMDWWSECLPLTDHLPSPVINLIVNQYTQAGGTGDMPYHLWAKLTAYHPRNKFYQEYNKDGQLDRAYEKAIRVAAGFWQRTASQTILERFTSSELRRMRKPIFASALVGYPHPQEIDLGLSRDYLGDARLSDQLTAVVKYAENILRKQARYPSKLSGVKLEPDLAKVLEIAFAPVQVPPPPIHISIDQARVASLHEESQVIGAMLEVDAAKEAMAQPKALLTDLTEMRQLWATFEAPYRYAIASIFNKELRTVDELTAKLLPYSIPPNIIIDDVNEKSLKVLGDRLIYEDDVGVLTLAEDFLDELEVVIAESSPEVIPVASPLSTVYDPWDDLLTQLAPVQIDLIRLFAERGGLAEDEIETVAKKHDLMANAALDALSEKATDILGHLPIFHDGDKWLMEEEDLKSLRQHLSIPETE